MYQSTSNLCPLFTELLLVYEATRGGTGSDEKQMLQNMFSVTVFKSTTSLLLTEAKPGGSSARKQSEARETCVTTGKA